MKIYESTSPDENETAGEPDKVTVSVAEYAVEEGPVQLSTSGLGSCIGVAICETTAGVYGLLHLMLPSATDTDTENAAKFADTGLDAIVDEMEEHGAERPRMEAKVAGGSSMLDFSGTEDGIGARNYSAVEEKLDDLGVSLVATDVGGNVGRSLNLDSRTCELTVRKANKETITL